LKSSEKNVIIGGSTKCGTTSLFRYLSDHPEICASVIKETRFFWDGVYDLPQQKINNGEIKNYTDFFFRCSEGQWKLEATPDYLYSISAAEKIKSRLPDCRFIFIFRNPTERIISWFKYSKQLGFLPATCKADDYMKLLMETQSKKTPQHLRALEQGKYGQFLECYLDLFGKQNILVTFQNDLQNDPASLMTSVCNFLNIETSHYDHFDFKIFNPSLNVKSVSQFNKYRQLKKKMRSYNNKLPASYRMFLKKILKPVDIFYLKSKSDKWEEKEISLSLSNIDFLSGYYQNDHQLLEKLLGKKITW